MAIRKSVKIPELPPFLLRIRLFAVVAGFALLILVGKGFLTIHGRSSDDTARAATHVTAADLNALPPEVKAKIQEQLSAHGLSTNLDEFSDLPTLVQAKISEMVANVNAKKSDSSSVSVATSPVSPLPLPLLGSRALGDRGVDVPPVPKEGFDPLHLTAHEMQVLESLSKRRDVLNQREKELYFKSALLNASEERINKKIAELKILEKGVTELLKAYKTQDDANLKSLATIYENMKPREAARILSDLETPVLLKVVTHMRAMRSSAILANMDTAKARDVTMALARDHKLMTETQKHLSALREAARATPGRTPQGVLASLGMEGGRTPPTAAALPERGSTLVEASLVTNVPVPATSVPAATPPNVSPPASVGASALSQGGGEAVPS